MAVTEHNHRRGTKGQTIDQMGYPWFGETSYRTSPDKSMQSWNGRGALSHVSVGASIGNDFTNGNRGMARSARGAKKFVRSRLRFHENQATNALARHISLDD